MATYYKYAERTADSFVNWAEIGKNMSDMLAQENKIREEKKAAIDESSRQLGLTLSNAPQGESKTMNEWALKYAGDAQAARLMQDKLLKSGQLKLKDYIVQRQNITDGTTAAFDLVKEYQEEFKTKWDRMKEDKSQDLEQFLMAEAEGFGNFNDSQLYINPTDGKVNVAKRVKKVVDGKEVYEMSQDPNDFTDINSLRSRIKGTFDKYDVNTNMETYVNALGTEIDSLVTAKNSLGATGTISEILDITKRTNLPKDMQGVVMKFEEAETKALQSQLANPYNTSSILTNSVNKAPNGKEYSFTWNPDDAKNNPEKILLKNKSNGNPEPVFSPEQEKVALEHLRLQARMRYDKKTEIKTTPQLERRDEPAYKFEAAREDKTKQDLATNFARFTGYLTSGTDEQKAEAVAYFRSQGVPLDSRKDGIYIENKKGELVPFKTGKGSTIDFGKSMIGALLTSSGRSADVDEETVVKLLPKYTKSSFNTTAIGKGIEAPRDVSGQFSEQVSSTISSDLFNDKKSTETGPKLQKILKKVPGVKISYSGTGSMFNDINIEYGTGSQKRTLKLNSNESGERADAQAIELKKFLDELPTSAKLPAIGPEQTNKPKAAAEVKSRISTY